MFGMYMVDMYRYHCHYHYCNHNHNHNHSHGMLVAKRKQEGPRQEPKGWG